MTQGNKKRQITYNTTIGANNIVVAKVSYRIFRWGGGGHDPLVL